MKFLQWLQGATQVTQVRVLVVGAERSRPVFEMKGGRSKNLPGHAKSIPTTSQTDIGAGAAIVSSEKKKKKAGPKKKNKAKTIQKEFLALAARRLLPSDLYKCSRCSIVQGNERMAEQHISSGACCRMHGKDSSTVNTMICKVSSREQNFLCPKCSQFFVYAQPAVTHIATCSPETLLPCTWPKAVAKALPMGNQAPQNQQISREKKSKAALGNRATRAQPSLSDDGLEAIVREVACRLKCPVSMGHKYMNYCSLAIDPDELFKYRCANQKCRQAIAVSKSNQENVTEYLWARRQTKKVLGLLSISVPLDAPSFYALGVAARSCGIISNTTQTHLTFAEGVRLPNPANGDSTDTYADWLSRTIHDVKLLQQALRTNPSVRIEALHAVPRSIDRQ